MKAISLWQPWASLIMMGQKHFETRSWATPYRGDLVIHAAKHWDMESYHDFYMKFFPMFAAFGITSHKQLPFGAAICMCTLADCLSTSQVIRVIGETEKLCGNYQPGRYAWKLTDIVPFDAPVPYRGEQGFFEYDYAKRKVGE